MKVKNTSNRINKFKQRNDRVLDITVYVYRYNIEILFCLQIDYNNYTG